MGLRHRCSESATQRACPVASISLACVPPVRATTKGRPSSFFVGTVAAVFLSPPDSPAAYAAQPLPTTAAAAATIAVKPHEVLRWLDVSTSVDSGADDSEVDVAAATVVEVTGFHDRAATEAAARTLRRRANMMRIRRWIRELDTDLATACQKIRHDESLDATVAAVVVGCGLCCWMCHSRWRRRRRRGIHSVCTAPIKQPSVVTQEFSIRLHLYDRGQHSLHHDVPVTRPPKASLPSPPPTDNPAVFETPGQHWILARCQNYSTPSKPYSVGTLSREL